MRSINSSFPKIDNLEYFPERVLLNIFANVDDIGLYNLAEESCRFEKIAKIVLNERYAHEYFKVDETNKKWKTPGETYVSFFRRFGKEIKAIEIKDVLIDKENHWITCMLDETNCLEKLTLDQCRIEYENLLKHASKNITHLILRSDSFSSTIFVPSSVS